MKITNKYNLPEPIVKAVGAGGYSKGGADYSVTELLDPVQIVHLKRRHYDEIEEDASDRIWALMGLAVHHVLQAADMKDHLQEEKIFGEYSGRKIKGQPDLFDGKKITDYKVTSVWTRIFGDRFKGWEAQVNLYAILFREAGFTVEGAEIVCIYRDWSATELSRDPERYPKAPVEAVKMKLWSPGDALDFLNARVELMKAAEAIEDKDLPPCTTEEMWEKPTTWAVMKEGRKSAVRVFDTETAANKMIASMENAHQNGVHSVEKRPGSRKRCEQYCPVAPFCKQFKAWKEAQG